MSNRYENNDSFFQKLYHTSLELLQSTDSQQTIHNIVDNVTELLGGSDAAVYRINESRTHLIPIYSNAEEAYKAIMDFPIAIGEGLSGKVAQTGESEFINYDDNDCITVHIDGTDYDEDDDESVLSTPMFNNGELSGVITVSKMGERFSEQDIKKLEIFTRLVEIVILRMRDIEYLHKSEETYKHIVQHSFDSIIIIDNEHIVYVNKTAIEFTGYTEEELKKNGLSLILDKSAVKSILKMNGNIDTQKEIVFESELTTGTDKKKIVEIRISKILYMGDILTMLDLKDLTEYYELEENRIQTAKLESLGILAGGMAHDFNNYLMAVSGGLSIIKNNLNDRKMLQLIKRMEAANNEAGQLTHRLLTFSKGGEPVKRPIDIEDILLENVKFALSGSNVQLQYEVTGNDNIIIADKSQLNQVINNIVINAVHAMPEGGILYLSKENTVFPEREPERFVKISFRDTGVGIPDDILPRIFDPYFSTRENGSGLGLSTVYSIIVKHDGFIEVTSEQNEGTQFDIYFPVSEDNDTANEEREKNKGCKELNCRVLILDDNEIVLSVVKEIIEMNGGRASITEEGSQTVHEYKEAMESGDPYDIVILDLTIPGGMGGRETIKELTELDKNVTAIVSSGYSNDPIMSQYREYGFAGVLRKPYRADDLTLLISELLSNQS
ncbi:MAG: ATP-binding protein [candidate division WOR-3 bacterium]|nr:ATP-binding protein [candidate division WOR-3 bacterium]